MDHRAIAEPPKLICVKPGENVTETSPQTVGEQRAEDISFATPRDGRVLTGNTGFFSTHDGGAAWNNITLSTATGLRP